MASSLIKSEFASARQCIVCLEKLANEIQLDSEKENNPTNGHNDGEDDSSKGKQKKSILEKKLFQCPKCNMVEYCSKEHQDSDWPAHKDFCGVMASVKKSCRVRHPLFLNGNNYLSAQLLAQSTRQLRAVYFFQLKRSPSRREEELIAYPSYCVICFSLEKLIHCDKCFGVSYCSVAHQTEDQSRHKEECNKIRLYYCLYQMVPLQRDPIKEFHMRVSNMQNYDLCSALERAALLKVPEDPTASFSNYSKLAHVSSFSYVSTICFGMSYVDINNYDCYKIFIVGATDEQDLYFQEMHMRFFFLQNDKMTNVNLYFIGPNALQKEPTTLKFMFRKKNRSVTYMSFVGLFQDFIKKNLIKPSLIIAFNPDLSGRHDIIKYYLSDIQSQVQDEDPLRSNKFTWPGAINEIVQTIGTPIFITSRTKLEASFDCGCILKAVVESRPPINCANIIRETHNPYAELLPQRNLVRGDGETIYYKNAYIQGIYTFP